MSCFPEKAQVESSSRLTNDSGEFFIRTPLSVGKSALRISNQDVFDSEYGGCREPKKDRRPEQGVQGAMAMYVADSRGDGMFVNPGSETKSADANNVRRRP